MSIWSTLGGMGAGILGGLASSGIEYGFGRAAAEDQMDMARRLAKKYPSWQAEGLERAGLNRILAIRPGPGSPPAPTMIGTPKVGQNISSMTAATAVKSQIAKTQADTVVADRQRRLLELDAQLKSRDLSMKDFDVAIRAIEAGWYNDPKFRSWMRSRKGRGEGFYALLSALMGEVGAYGQEAIDAQSRPHTPSGEMPEVKGLKKAAKKKARSIRRNETYLPYWLRKMRRMSGK